MRIDLGKLTAEESVELLKELINIVPSEQLMETLSECLTMEQIDELQERLP